MVGRRNEELVPKGHRVTLGKNEKENIDIDGVIALDITEINA